MRKYTRPEMECRAFASENILTASGGTGAGESSMTRLQKDLTENYGVSSENIVTDLW